MSLARPRPLEIEEHAPLLVKPIAPQHWFFDFGRAAFGTLRLRLPTPSAHRLTLTVHLGEKLDETGTRIDRQPPGCIRTCSLPLTFEAGASEATVVLPPDPRNTGPAAIRIPPGYFEVFPFRYAEITGTAQAPDPTRLALFYPFDEQAAAFHCEDQALEQVWELCRYSIKATSFCGLYVDGDRERIPYEGDAYINQLCHYGVDAEYEIARATLEHLLFHSTWPTEWSLHCLPMAWHDYLYSGRSDFLAAYFDLLEQKALLPLARHDGLISTETGLVTPELLRAIHLDPATPLRDMIDWPPGSFTEGQSGERDGYEMVPVKTVINAFFLWNLDLLAQSATVLGYHEKANFFRERYCQARESFERLFFCRENGYFIDGEGSTHASLHANMIPAALGLLPAGEEERVMAFIRSRGMACSVYGAHYLLEACYRYGAADHALSLMTASHDRSWLHMLKIGSTITLEAWDLRYKNNLDWNHAWGAVPAHIIPHFLVGVRPATPGFASVLLEPQPGPLRHFEAKVPTPRGPVHVVLQPDALEWESPVPVLFRPKGLDSTPGSHALPAGRHRWPLKAN